MTWSDIPESDGRRLFIGWNSNWDYAQVVPTRRWRSAMTVPRSLRLIETDAGLRIASEPVAELQRLRAKRITLELTTVDSSLHVAGLANASQFEAIVRFDVEAGTGDSFGIELTNDGGATYRLGYDRAGNRLFSDRTNAGPSDFSDKFAAGPHSAPHPASAAIQLHLFVDRSSVEAFVDSGHTVMSELVFPSAPFNEVRLFSEGGSTELLGAVFYPLRSIWQ